MNTSEEKDYAVIGKFGSIIEADILIGLLEGNGIDCFLSDTSFADLFPGNPLLNKIEVRVRTEDQKRAMEILNAKFDEKELQG